MKIPCINTGRNLIKLNKRRQPSKAGNHRFKQNRTALIPIGSILLALCLLSSTVWAEVNVVDDKNRTIHLSQPAKRIVSLAPNVTELLFEIGAGEDIVGTVEYSDYPQAAKTIPRIGRHNALDLETIVMLKPDLVIAWQSGNPVQQVEKLVNLGIPVYYSELRKLMDVADTLQRFGKLTGLQANAQRAQQAFVTRYRRLNKDYQHKSKIKVFYEIWNQPMMSVNGDHIINEVIELCGGENVFKSLAPLTPTVNVEAVLLADPEVIIASGVGDAPPPWLGEWDRWRQLSAVKHGHVYYVNPDYIHRQTSRILIGAERVCSLLDKARKP
jgi:iron complex transport system substrate-binding protein